MASIYDNLRHGARFRIGQYRRKFGDSWRSARWITPHGLGFAAPSATARHTPRSEPGPFAGCIHMNSGALDHLREVRPVDEILNVGHRGWYCDAHESETIRGHVARLPGRRRKQVWVAFIRWSNADGITAEGTTYDSEHAAARAAESLAESVARVEREYSERWNESQRLEDKAEGLREELSAARGEFQKIAKAWREQRKLGEIAATVCELLQARANIARELFAHALGELVETRETIARDYADIG